MNRDIKQILYNQRAMMEVLESMDEETIGYLQNRIAETTKILGDGEKEKEESSCYVQENKGENKSDEICECGHHREYHIHDYNTKTAEEICEKCECKNFKLKNYALEEKSE